MAFAWSSPEAFSAKFDVAVTSSAFMVGHSFQATRLPETRGFHTWEERIA